MASHRVVEVTVDRAELDIVLIMAITISVLAIGGVYVTFVADESVSNAVVASAVMGATIAVVFAWASYAGHKFRGRLNAIEAQVQQYEQERQVDQLLERATGADGPIRRLPSNVRRIH